MDGVDGMDRAEAGNVGSGKRAQRGTGYYGNLLMRSVTTFSSRLKPPTSWSSGCQG